MQLQHVWESEFLSSHTIARAGLRSPRTATAISTRRAPRFKFTIRKVLLQGITFSQRIPRKTSAAFVARLSSSILETRAWIYGR